MKACYSDIIECAYNFINPATLGLLVQGQLGLLRNLKKQKHAGVVEEWHANR